MPSNSALMQSYNLMKMSSEVTKTQAAPQFMAQERGNNQYNFNPQPAPQAQPQPSVDFNMPMYAQQRMPNNQQVNDQNAENNFLGNFLNNSNDLCSWNIPCRNGNSTWSNGQSWIPTNA